MKTKIFSLLFFACLLITVNAFSQSESTTQTTYHKTVGYLSFIFPIVTYKGTEFTPNFKYATTIGFPFGVSVLYSDRFGFSYEITPSIQAVHSANKSATSKTSNILFDPGPMFRFQHGFTIITRLAFETSGRYGFTPVFNKVIFHTKPLNYFMAGSLPVRFGNNDDASIGVNLQFGIIFN